MKFLPSNILQFQSYTVYDYTCGITYIYVYPYVQYIDVYIIKTDHA